MNTILRNLFYTLHRFRTASRLNLLGLSAAFAAFVVMMMKVGYERSFNTCYPEADRIAILDINIDEEPSISVAYFREVSLIMLSEIPPA